ncbi:alpha/beta hydrolase [Singulisphaera sp. PoT]|uniref:alpha/beta hydrolase n=1 Tax=Singulisphaera sp. PoT TaxID=3411797 RepID=UPI003BF48F58
MSLQSCLMEEPETQQPNPAPRRPRGPRPEPAPVRRRPSWPWRIARIFVLVYVGLAGVLFSLQSDLIFPGAKRQGQPDTVVKPRPDEELVTLTTAKGDKVIALFAPALSLRGEELPDATIRPTILYFYGNAMCLSDAVDQLEHFRKLGFNVMIPDYVGYGMSGGKASEAGCQATADAALAHLRTRKDIDPRKIVAAGWSLGGAVAIDLASREKVAGLISFCTFTSMGDMSRKNFPFLPASLLLRHRFDSLSKMSKVSCPVLIGHGARDTLIPHAMAEKLAEAAHTPVMKFTVDAAGHNDFFAVGGSQVLLAMKTYIEQLMPSE